ELNLVPYKGSAPAASDLVAGQIPLAMLDVPSALGFVQADKVKALGVTAAARIHALPQIPTVAEGGVAGYESVGWFGLVAPAGTPAAIVGPLHQAVAAALADPETAKRFADVGAQPASSTPEAFGTTIRSEIAKWAKVIAVSGAKVD